MTHIPNIELEARRGKGVTLCGRTISVRKLRRSNVSCPDCGAFPGDNTLFPQFDEITRDQIDRSASIRAQRAFARRRWRK